MADELEVGRALREPALVSDQAPSGLDPSGFDPARAVSVLAEAIHDRLFGVASLGDPAMALAEISDGGGIHEAAHALLRALPPRQSAKVTLCSFCGKSNNEVPWMLTSEIGAAAICTECLVSGCVLVLGLRDRDGAEGGDANAAPVPQDRQARAEGIAQNPEQQHD